MCVLIILFPIRFLTFLEKALKHNGGGEGFFIGDKVCCDNRIECLRT